MSAFLPPTFCSPDEDDDDSMAQALRKARYHDYGLPVRGTCWQCGAVGEVWAHGAIHLCGDHMDAVSVAVERAVAQSMPVPAELMS